MKHLDLFSGIGGFALAARAVGWQTVGFCENEPYCQAVLRQHWPGVPVYDDVRTLDGRAVGPVGIVTGGYPCQPFSLAGERRGADDDRHLWPAMHRIIDELRPAWVVGENVAGHVSMGLDDVLSDLERSGYACRTFAIPAVAVDARHRRERLWIVANADERVLRDHEQRAARRRLRIQDRRQAESRDDGTAQLVADAERAERRPHAAPRGVPRADGDRPQDGQEGSVWARGSGEDVPDAAQLGRRQGDQDTGGCSARTGAAEERGGLAEPCRWEPEPDVGRVAHGIPARAHRLRALGNAIVPQVATEIFRAINMTEFSGDSKQ